ncbi:MAG: hypothetical protein RL094_716 [Candidatus Parcubacteria bacterium]|jgi:membrane-bound inhibitor of C-type lysozyme
MKKLFTFVVLIALAAIFGALYIKLFRATPTVVVTPVLVYSAEYSCDKDMALTASYYDASSTVAVKTGQKPVPTGSVKIALDDGRSFTIAQTISASGVRYANADESFVFWSKGKGVMILEQGQEKEYKNCVEIDPNDPSTTMSAEYKSTTYNFSLRFPRLAKLGATTSVDSFVAVESYINETMGPNKKIPGVKFTIPTNYATGTNLSRDSFISVEQLSNTAACSADLFLDQGVVKKSQVIIDGQVTYSVASTSEAAVGNRYEEYVYALPGSNPCTAVRYFIHYGAIENYDTTTVKQFDKAALLAEFNKIRRTLIVNQ